ncbi:MAG TPA: biotin--[acetyl-CoA-carboxylase] ligase [Candidatus Stackebrandtia faecavium]|nr:biotin--[acetyl-CoA-carboxylase] ligase [Candidatus Stackebrandtia faecavium]
MNRSPLDGLRLQRCIDHSDLWSGIDIRDSVDSTNTVLSRLAAESAEGSVLTTEQQTHGRGRSGRNWVTPPRAGIAVSVLLRPHVPMVRWSWLSLLAGVCVSEAIADTCALSTKLKWPNDVLTADRGAKVCGILAEVSARSVVLGIGINVSLEPHELPRTDTTSLELETNESLDRTALLVALLRRLEDRYRRWSEADGHPEGSGIAQLYRERSHTLGSEVTATLPGGGTVRGVAADIDADGRLRINTVAGPVEVAAGDVQRVR